MLLVAACSPTAVTPRVSVQAPSGSTQPATQNVAPHETTFNGTAQALGPDGWTVSGQHLQVTAHSNIQGVIRVRDQVNGRVLI
jgi:hypothetical protein